MIFVTRSAINPLEGEELLECINLELIELRVDTDARVRTEHHVALTKDHKTRSIILSNRHDNIMHKFLDMY